MMMLRSYFFLSTLAFIGYLFSFLPESPRAPFSACNHYILVLQLCLRGRVALGSILPSPCGGSRSVKDSLRELFPALSSTSTMQHLFCFSLRHAASRFFFLLFHSVPRLRFVVILFLIPMGLSRRCSFLYTQRNIWLEAPIP